MSIPKAFCGLCCFLGILHAAHAFDGACTAGRWDAANKAIHKSSKKLKAEIFSSDLEIFMQCTPTKKDNLALSVQKTIIKEYIATKCNKDGLSVVKCELKNNDLFKPNTIKKVLLPEYLIKKTQPTAATVVFFKTQRSNKKKQDVPLSLSGGDSIGYQLTYIFHKGAGGHYEITSEAMQKAANKLGIKFTSSFVDYMSNASRDPDNWEWGSPAAHGQATVNEKRDTNEYLQLTQNTSQAKKSFQDWTSNNLKKSMQSCMIDTDFAKRKAAYLLGYAMHAIQDAVFHAGISNAHHSFLDYHDKNNIEKVDYGKEFFEIKKSLAIDLTSDLFVKYYQIANVKNKNTCISVFLSNKNWIRPTNQEIIQITNLGKEIIFNKIVDLEDYYLQGKELQNLLENSAREKYKLSDPWFPWWGDTSKGKDIQYLRELGFDLMRPIHDSLVN